MKNQEAKITNKKLVLFHEGRGGRFNNGGQLSARGIITSFDPEYYGISIFIDEETQEVSTNNGEVICTVDEMEADIGTFNIDNEYDTYHWKPLEDLSDDEFKYMLDELSTHEYEDLLRDKEGINKQLLEFILKLDEDTDLKIAEFHDYLFSSCQDEDFEVFLDEQDFMIFDTEEQADDAEEKYWGSARVEFEGKYYIKE